MKEFIVIGCGRFGQSLVKSLSKQGYDVLAIDKDGKRVQEISEYATHAIEMDVMDEQTLKSISINNFDVAVVSIGGDNIQASIMATLLIREMGAKKIIAKAQSDIHAKVLYKIGADKVVFPERDMGVKVAHSLTAENILDIIELDTDYSIMEITALKDWEGKALKRLNLSNKFGINVMAIKAGSKINISPSAETIVKKNDILIAIGETEDLNKLGEKN